MANTNNKDHFLMVYAYSMCLFAFAAVDVSWLSRVPLFSICIYIIIISLIKLSGKIIHASTNELFSLFFLFVYSLLSFFVFDTLYLYNAAVFFALLSILMLPINEKGYFLRAITNCFVIVLLISIPAWILYLIGVPLPHSGVIYHSNGFHEFYDYYFFRVSSKDLTLFPRFGSIFLEPGQMATPCAFLFFLNGANFSRKNLVLLTAIVLSFSLIAYGLVMISFLANRFLSSSKYRVVKILSATFLVLGVSLFFSRDEASDDPVTAMIVSRLEYDEEKVISGNNRLSGDFRIRYNHFIQSEDRYLGIRDRLLKGNDWTYNSSGILKFIVHRGLIGLSVFMLFVFMLFWNKRSLENLIWLIILVAAFVVRDMLQTPLWCSIAIVGFYLRLPSKANNALVKNLKTVAI